MPAYPDQIRRPPRLHISPTPKERWMNNLNGSGPPTEEDRPNTATYRNNYGPHLPERQRNPAQYWSPHYHRPTADYRSPVGHQRQPMEQAFRERKRLWLSSDLDAMKSKDCQIEALKSALAAQKFIDNNSEKDCKIEELKNHLKAKEKEIVNLQRRNLKLKQQLEAKEQELKNLQHHPSNSYAFQMMRRRLEGAIAERNEEIKSLKSLCAKLEKRMKHIQQAKVNPVCEWHRASISPQDMEYLKNFDIHAPLDDPEDDTPVYLPRALDKSVIDAIGKTPEGVDFDGTGAGNLTTLPELRSSRTRLCTFFALSQCYKKDCHFAHGLRELQPFNVKNYKSDDCMGVVGCLGLDCKYRHGETRTALRDGFYLVYGGNLDAPRLCYMPEGDERENAEEKFHANLGTIINRLERLLPKKLLPAQIIMVYRDY